MKITKCLIFYFLLCWILFPAAANDEVHFGTIFVEDIEYQNSEDKQSINHLTDQSTEQRQLENLYKEEIGSNNEKLKKMDLSPRAPSSTPTKNTPAKKLGVVRNAELPKQIIYFIELRSFVGSQPKTISQSSQPGSKVLMNAQPGELLKIVDTPDQYIHKMHMDRDNKGLWKTISTREEDVQGSQIYYDWRDFDTITSHDFPIELDIVIPPGKNSMPVFSRPGVWTWKDCGLSEDLCLDSIDIHTKAYLFDSTIVDTRTSEKLNSDYRLFYKIGYQIKDKNGELHHKVGWIPSVQAKRKISQLPKSLLATREPGSFSSYESDMERMQRLQKYYVFDANMRSDNKNLNRWISSDPGQTTEVFFQNLAFDAVAHVNNFHLEQDFLTDEFTQTGIAAGFGVYAPIFLDLEIQGTATFTFPLSATETDVLEKAYLFRGEQWLLYTTPWSVNGTPFKFGVGGYYITMFASQKQFGFNSLVGFQLKGLFENPGFWFGSRYGPTGQDFSFKFENRELGADIGIRLDPSRHYESWSIYMDYSDTSYISPSKNKTKFQILQLGIRKQF